MCLFQHRMSGAAEVLFRVGEFPLFELKQEERQVLGFIELYAMLLSRSRLRPILPKCKYAVIP
jgi:hypothetical protein